MQDTNSPTKTQERLKADWLKMRNAVLIRDGSRCRFCDARNASLVVRFQHGAAADPSDHATACGPCLRAAKKVGKTDFEGMRSMVREIRHLDRDASSELTWSDDVDRDAHLTRREIRNRKKLRQKGIVV